MRLYLLLFSLICSTVFITANAKRFSKSKIEDDEPSLLTYRKFHGKKSNPWKRGKGNGKKGRERGEGNRKKRRPGYKHKTKVPKSVKPTVAPVALPTGAPYATLVPKPDPTVAPTPKPTPIPSPGVTEFCERSYIPPFYQEDGTEEIQADDGTMYDLTYNYTFFGGGTVSMGQVDDFITNVTCRFEEGESEDENDTGFVTVEFKDEKISCSDADSILPIGSILIIPEDSFGDCNLGTYSTQREYQYKLNGGWRNVQSDTKLIKDSTNETQNTPMGMPNVGDAASLKVFAGLKPGLEVTALGLAGAKVNVRVGPELRLRLMTEDGEYFPKTADGAITTGDCDDCHQGELDVNIRFDAPKFTAYIKIKFKISFGFFGSIRINIKKKWSFDFGSERIRIKLLKLCFLPVTCEDDETFEGYPRFTLMWCADVAPPTPLPTLPPSALPPSIPPTSSPTSAPNTVPSALPTPTPINCNEQYNDWVGCSEEGPCDCNLAPPNLIPGIECANFLMWANDANNCCGFGEFCGEELNTLRDCKDCEEVTRELQVAGGDDLDLYLQLPSGMIISVDNVIDAESMGRLVYRSEGGDSGCFNETIVFPVDGTAPMGIYTFWAQERERIGMPDKWELVAYLNSTEVVFKMGQFDGLNTMSEKYQLKYQDKTACLGPPEALA